LGSGGFGEVFLAQDNIVTNRQVAIKVLTGGSERDRDNLIWEMKALAGLNYPGVVAFHHNFSVGERLFLVMEYCRNGSLQDRLFGGQALPERQVFGWGLTLCRTLGFVHGKGIIHHDIKPANILFGEDGQIKLGDFGVANRNIGTVIYLPPEMLLGQSDSKDGRVDVYALGLTLLECLTGRHPFIDLPANEGVRVRFRHDFVPTDLPRWVQEVMLKATHPDPDLRFQTMQEFAEAIEGKHVPYAFDAARMKAHALAEKAEVQIKRRKWKSAEKLAFRALRSTPDCVAALLALGRCQLLLRRLDQARECFDRAVAISPRTQVQKELGWLNMEAGRVPAAISLLTDHLQRNAADYEAYVLLLKCYYLTDRFEAAEDLAQALKDQKAPHECFHGNLFIARLLGNGYAGEDLAALALPKFSCPFLTYNLAVAAERPRAWSDDPPGPSLKSKLLFEEYRFAVAKTAGRRNTLKIETPNGRITPADPIVTIGWLPANDVVIKSPGISRRHCVIVNFPDDVWLYDLESACGTTVDGTRVIGRTFLDGVHEVDVGPVRIRVAAKADLLV
jgi:serine/threonine protein kinase